MLSIDTFTHPAGDYNHAILAHGFFNDFHGLLLGAVDRATSVDHYYFGIVIARNNVMAFRCSLVSMRSESTSALGQAGDTKPSFLSVFRPSRNKAGMTLREAQVYRSQNDCTNHWHLTIR